MKEDFEIAAGIEQDFNPYAKNYDKKNPKESLKFQLKIIGKFNKIYDEDSVVDLDLDEIDSKAKKKINKEGMVFELFPSKSKLMILFENSINKDMIFKMILDISKELLKTIIFQYAIITIEIALSFVHPLLGFLVGFLKLMTVEKLKVYPVTEKNIDEKYILGVSYRIKAPILSIVKMEIDFGVTNLKNGIFKILDYIKKIYKSDKNINLFSELEEAIEESINESSDEMNELEENVKKEKNILKEPPKDEELNVIDLENYSDYEILKKYDLIKDHAKSYLEATGNSYFGIARSTVNDYGLGRVKFYAEKVGKYLNFLIWGTTKTIQFLNNKTKKFLKKEKLIRKNGNKEIF